MLHAGALWVLRNCKNSLPIKLKMTDGAQIFNVLIATASSSSLKFGIEFGHVTANTHLQIVQKERVKGQSKVYK